ncbi:LuxR family transcriptional regulator [Methylobacterium sp. Leaf104]|uniref:substrate-binding domain-containing protein n=1 Tax=Methylobacterium TaxID=407 RepID=UPI0006F231A5|nr:MULTISPECIES: substrate-binding domain-containing protein [Methylobacterium]KQP40047.1 LuxR family transcriptional regulator [Methylobacterium sp. Leaf104]MCI9881927.1 helix-turn-helix transcriptional regulator [Methylobacterium goesingense]
MTQASDTPSLLIDLGLGGTITVGSHRVSVSEAVIVLEAIAATGSVQGIATALGLSYRAAWERLRALEAGLGHQLVQKTRGHGSALTPTGQVLREALGAAAGSLAEPMAREARALRARLGPVLSEDQCPLTLVASHDLLLMEVAAAWPGITLAVAGSEDAVARLTEARADGAGFHCGALDWAAAGPAFAALAADPGFRVRPLFEREQGLMLAAGNPLAITDVADLATRDARYVNRQKGSGTRVWFDRLLAEHEIPTERIRGYATEEFTHQAVAAVIAYGAADAGLGARAAADRFGLDFLSVGWERYYLATSSSLADAAFDALAEALAERAGRTPGYRPAAPKDAA